MYDLDITEAEYQRLYRRMRSLCGLNDEYQNARERTLLLSAAAEGVDRSFRDKRDSRLAVVAGIVGAGILGFTVALLFAGNSSANAKWLALWITLGALLVALVLLLVWQSWSKRKRRDAVQVVVLGRRTRTLRMDAGGVCRAMWVGSSRARAGHGVDLVRKIVQVPVSVGTSTEPRSEGTAGPFGRSTPSRS